MEITGRIALVTGGTKGIGAATAVALAEHGADVAIAGRHDDAEAARTREAIETHGRRSVMLTADMKEPAAADRCVREAADRLGGLDILVHSAGGVVGGGLFEVTPEAWHEGFAVHVHAAYHLCRSAVPVMRPKKEGAIVLVSSVAGIRGLKMNLAYQVVKGTIPALTRGLAFELADDNIRVNAVAPGIIRTRFHDAMTPEQKQYNLDHRIPLHREGTPADVARLICELAANDYMTGETVVVDGGLTMRIA
jgi:NAD(P)-dependent dehydrogenase (short-subunit alcohol dehydrogenase family)